MYRALCGAVSASQGDSLAFEVDEGVVPAIGQYHLITGGRCIDARLDAGLVARSVGPDTDRPSKNCGMVAR